jgi:hypothetical protein
MITCAPASRPATVSIEVSGADRDCALGGAHRANKARQEEQQRTGH